MEEEEHRSRTAVVFPKSGHACMRHSVPGLRLVVHIPGRLQLLLPLKGGIGGLRLAGCLGGNDFPGSTNINTADR